jgi:winged helix-turn helix protein
MSQAAKVREQDRKARARLRVLHHQEQVTRNVSQTCRFFGISRSLFYICRDRYHQDGLVGLRDGARGLRDHPFTTPAHIVALILEVRWQRQHGPLWISLFLQRYQQVYVFPPTIQRILKPQGVPVDG